MKAVSRPIGYKYFVCFDMPVKANIDVNLVRLHGLRLLGNDHVFSHDTLPSLTDNIDWVLLRQFR